MTPLKLTLKGFIGIRDGMGRDELTLDLSAVEGDIVALLGPNGIGKTTILDNLHPYRIMPGRATSYSPNGFSYWDQIYGPEASKTLLWSHAGKTYQSSLIFRSTGKTQKAEAYLQVLNSGPIEFESPDMSIWKPFIAEDRTCSDGKTSTYDVCIESILGAPELYFTAAFSAQGRRLLSSYTNGEIKSLLASLLGLNHIEELGRAAAARRLNSERALGDVRTRHGDSSQIESKRQQILNEKTSHLARETELQSEIEKQKLSVESATAAVIDAKANAQQAETAAARRQEIEQQLDTLAANEKTDTESARRRRDEAAAALNYAKEHSKTEIDRLTRQIAHLTEEINTQTKLLNERPQIEKAVNNVKEMEASLVVVDQELEALQIEINELKSAPHDAAQKAQEVSAHAEKSKALTARVEDLRKRSQLIDDVPCAGTDLQQRCQLLVDAVEARDTLVTLEEEIGRNENLHSLLETSLKTLQDLANRWRARNERHDQRSRERDTLLRQLSQERLIAAKRVAMEQAETAIARLQTDKTEAEGAKTALEENNKQHIETLEKNASDARLEPLHVQERYEALRKPLQNELLALPAPQDSDVATAEQALQNEKNRQSELENALSSHRNSRLDILDRERQVQAEADKAAAAAVELRKMEDDLAAWTALSKALGPNGIIALVIDDAGPTIASLANELLTACYGPRFTVRIETQREKTDGTFAEDFDITVFDAMRDEKKSISVMSGGERIWINEALCRAVALFQAQQAGHHYECLMSDEADGALDGEKRQQFMAMKRKVLEIGNYDREIFISHSPETWDVADTKINLQEYVS